MQNESLRSELKHFRPFAKKHITDTEKGALLPNFSTRAEAHPGISSPLRATCLLVSSSLKRSDTGKTGRAATKGRSKGEAARAEDEKMQFHAMFESVASEVNELRGEIAACEGDPAAVRKMGRLKSMLASRLTELREIDKTLSELG